jgi:hypothetical protein
VSEVEREHWRPVPFGNRHHSGVHEPEVEIGVLLIQLHSASQETRRQERRSVVTNRERAKERARLPEPDPVSNDVIDLDGNRTGDDQGSSETNDERSRKPVCRITAIESRDERSGVGDDGQRFSSAARRYSSTRRLRSGGPSPEPT